MATSTIPSPPEQGVEEGTYAMCVTSSPNVLFQYEVISPYHSDMEWSKEAEFGDGSIPPADLVGAEFTQDQEGHTWVFARDIDPEGEVTAEEVNPDEQATPEEQARYLIHFDSGNVATGNTQAEVMADTIGVMIQSYNLLDEIDLPYGNGYKNALLNDEPKHLDGSEMERAAEVRGGYYFTKKLSGKQKIAALEELAEKCGAEVEFGGDW